LAVATLPPLAVATLPPLAVSNQNLDERRRGLVSRLAIAITMAA
jgi:hypothetical protein